MTGETNAVVKDARIQMLGEALFRVDCILQRRSQDDHAIIRRVTLLEGELVGALTMKIVIGNAIVKLMERNNDESLIGDIEATMKKLLLIGRKLSGVLVPSECEVLYGRCGYLKGKLVYSVVILPRLKNILTKYNICFVFSSNQVHPDRDT